MKFFKLLKKEISELFTKEIIISMIFTVVLLFAMGHLMTGAMQDIIFSDTVNLIDCDNTEFTAEIKKFLEENGYEVNLLPADKYTGNIAEDMKNYGEAEAILIPEGFTEKILNEKKPSEITVICSMKSTTSVAAMTSGASVYDAAGGIEFVVEKMLYEKYGISSDDSIFAQTAVEVGNVTIAGEKYANVGVEAVASVTMMRNMVVVMMIFFLVLFASQMIITAIATEKIDKTLETLLSAPVSRMTIILSKMTAAAIVSIINAVAYMIGFAGYMSGMSAGMSPEELGNMVSSGEV
ncbi:MAG: ABC transporter permease, partial [Oscillospiraceae bacterium]|nr:ABC transporter permease [Oscillospiraceae bacterium]